MKKMSGLLVVLLASVGLAQNVSAAGIDFTPITTAVDVSTLIAAIAAVAVLKFGPRFTKWAYGVITSMFGGK